ncbi:MAG: alpha/beta hydrolase [Chloroflexota bacterium]
MGRRRLTLALGLGAGVLVGAAVAQRYRLERRRALRRLLAGSSVLDTARGPVECAVLGDGPVVLVSHGAAGGYDQGLLIGLPLVAPGFRVLSVSRDGYLRSPRQAEWSPVTQAERFAALLEVMAIQRVAVLAASAGGPAALEFARRYPERCWALVMVSAFSRRLRAPRRSRVPAIVQPLVFRSTFLPWVVLRLARRSIVRALGIDPRQMHQDRTLRLAAEALLDPVALTPDLRRAGTLLDINGIATLADFPLQTVRAPCLVVHGTLDPFVPYDHARRLAQALPKARLLTVRGGGHLCLLTHQDDIYPEIVRFLRQHQP